MSLVGSPIQVQIAIDMDRVDGSGQDFLAEFADTIELFEAKRRRRPGSRGIATVHDSGAERALCADLAHELGVEFSELAAPTLAKIGAQLDEGLAAGNPLDVWGTGADTRELFGACLRAMVDDPGVAVTALAIDLVSEFDGDTAYADAAFGPTWDADSLTINPYLGRDAVEPFLTAAKAAGRGVVNVSTGGIGAPVVSVIEDIVSLTEIGRASCRERVSSPV